MSINDTADVIVEEGLQIHSSELQKDVGSHYRYSITRMLTDRERITGQVIFKLDPYRICDLYQVGGGAREHIVKKALRGVRKGHTEQQLINELRACLDRWEEMLHENTEIQNHGN